ncbi:uncharacterized protein LOC111075361 [Drosophila obscura]|uniref:uncharacterized protein LOC111075361 n=1 Tax=Drosophila obscura TaxID=7282 RepID=UPI001BB1C37B|nr:uncharacterized protein LOC111075361 [Drosophila obscura]
MDSVYVKFLMCQCLVNRADWGLTIGFINVLYSLYMFHFWVLELFMSQQDYTVKWLLLYGFNVMFNVITMMRIVKRESIAVFYWICETAALLLFHLYYTYACGEFFGQIDNSMFVVLNVTLDVYILLSLLVMIYVMWGLYLEPDRRFPKELMRNNYKYDPEAAAAKKAAEDKKDRLQRQREREVERETKLEKENFNEEMEMEETISTNDYGQEENLCCAASDTEQLTLFSDLTVDHLCSPSVREECRVFLDDNDTNDYDNYIEISFEE